ncbi:uncharacterized protein LOC105703613 [Orussus abietinus]|uniref:uncharacterized protein LOC105703613 n=1 Tax=Orussus abietinus TaxID=222816 RepID=UPI00062669DA|nr:uncharacterized protein LOC105703613 [Orussus abietinus]
MTSVVPEGCVCSNLPTSEGIPSKSPKSCENSNSKVVSEILTKGTPYKEIEAIINDNYMVMRIEKVPVDNEWNPPCDCDDNHLGKQNRRGSNGPIQFKDNVIFQKAESAQIPPEEGGTDYRTVTTFPEFVIDAPTPGNVGDDENKDKKDKPLIEREENPNIFLLRIRKRCEYGERKHSIDLEFRAPRPWKMEPNPA